MDLQVELVQEDEGIQRSEEPVSKSMRNFWAGVPTEIEPAHSRSSSSSVSASLWRLARWSGRTARGLMTAPSLKTWVPTFFSRLIRFARCLLECGVTRKRQHCICMMGEQGAAYLRVLTVWMRARSGLKVPSSLVRDERFSMGMATPILGVTMGFADARSARATVMRVALQNMVGEG